jgi:hypothetical protein
MIVLLSTKELVRKRASGVPHWWPSNENKSFVYIALKQSSNMQFLVGRFCAWVVQMVSLNVQMERICH